MSLLLDVQSVTGGYGAVTVLRGISIHMDVGENIGLFGPNGHGKSTLLRSISGLLRPTSGRHKFDGKDITRKRPSDIVGAGLVHAQQGNTLFGEMTVREILELSAFTYRAQKGAAQALDHVLTLFPRLAERSRQKAKTLSGGERQMLSIGSALMCSPRLLMLDEPTLGLSPKLKEELSVALKDISRNVPLIIVEQDVELLLSVTDRLYLIEHGEVQREINKDNAPDHAEIMDMYFGAHDQ